MSAKKIIKGFNFVAPFYDFFVQCFFGNSIANAQTYFLPCIKKATAVLIFGGGTGKILEACLQQNVTANYCYVDISPKMIALAKQKVQSKNVTFIAGSYADIPAQKFDVIITPFVLDCFTDDDLQNSVVPSLESQLSPQGKWLFSDFTYSKTTKIHAFISMVVIRMLYFSFRLACAIPSKTLPDFARAFCHSNLVEINTNISFGGMLITQVYRKK